MKNCLKYKFTAILMIMLLTTLLCTAVSVAEEQPSENSAQAEMEFPAEEGTISESGVYDGVDWRLTSNGILIIGNGTEQVFDYKESRSFDSFPWWGMDGIDYVRFDGIVKGNGSMSGMFHSCKAKVIDLTGFQTEDVTSMKAMFGKSSFKKLDLSGFNTEKVTDMSSMFDHSKAKDIDLSGLNTEHVLSFRSMFFSASAESLDLSSVNTEHAADMSMMFADYQPLRKIILGEKFRFKGDHIEDVSSQALLSRLNVDEDLDWIKEDGSAGPMTPEALRDGYDENAVSWAGTWIVANAPED